MAFILTLLIVILTYLTPLEVVPELAPYHVIVWLAVIGLLVSLGAAFSGRFTFRPLQLYLIILFAAAIALSRINQGWLGGAVAALEAFAPALAILYLIALSANTFRKLRILAVVLVLITCYFAIQGILSYHFGFRGDTLILSQDIGADNGDASGAMQLRRIRGLGFLNDPNDLAQSIVISLALLTMAWRRHSLVRNLLIVMLPATLLLYAIYLTASRGAWISIMLLVALLLRDRFGWKVFFACLLVGVLLLVGMHAGGRSFTGSDESSQDRIEAWSLALQLLKQSPVFGIGFDFFTEHNEITAHNSFLLCAAELGLLGYVLWISLLFVSFREVNSLTKLTADKPLYAALSSWAHGLRLALVVFLCSAFFLSRTYVITLYILIGMIVVLAEIARREKIPELAKPRMAWIPQLAGISAGSLFAVYLGLRLQHLL